MPSHRSGNHFRSQDSDSSGFDDPAEWSIASYCPGPIAGLEPVTDDAPNPYRDRALDYLDILRAVDLHVSSSRDPRLAWVSIATVLDLGSTRGRSLVELSRQMGCSEDALSNSRARFRKLSGLIPRAEDPFRGYEP